MTFFKKTILYLCILGMAIISLTGLNLSPVYAEDATSGMGISPMKEKVILTPGETYNGSFVVTNPAKNTTIFDYQVSVLPFFATEDYNITYENTGDYNQMVNWITLDTTSGSLSPNDTNEIKFKISVPKDAPAGGQYAAIIVRSAENNTEANAKEGTGLQINQAMAIAHTIFAEVTGASIHEGKVTTTNLPSFMFNGKISASSTIENTGNVHGAATYKLQVYPLFSNEEVYTNEENPDTTLVLPGRTLYHETVWNETPMIGIFNVVYTVEYEGITTEISKLVIICPLWLLFIIIFGIVAIIIWLIIRIKMRKKSTDD